MEDPRPKHPRKSSGRPIITKMLLTVGPRVLNCYYITGPFIKLRWQGAIATESKARPASCKDNLTNAGISDRGNYPLWNRRARTKLTSFCLPDNVQPNFPLRLNLMRITLNNRPANKKVCFSGVEEIGLINGTCCWGQVGPSSPVTGARPRRHKYSSINSLAGFFRPNPYLQLSYRVIERISEECYNWIRFGVIKSCRAVERGIEAVWITVLKDLQQFPKPE